jgi:hypothetical protein
VEEYAKIALLVLVSTALSAVIMTSIKVPAEGVGREILSSWSSETGLEDLNSSNALWSLWFRLALVITLTQLFVALIYAAFVLK